MARFTVDTHLFRELGELLVGRNSTALVELIKNAYDADATEVSVFGERLTEPESALISVVDNGTGMTMREFERGFLRIASREKESGNRRSKRLKRRYTGEKGIGRLAAHKLARLFSVGSVTERPRAKGVEVVEATIDWDAIERYQTLDQVDAPALVVRSRRPSRKLPTGTTLTMTRLRQAWTPAQLGRFVAEVQTFEPPQALVQPLPKDVRPRPLLFRRPRIRDAPGKPSRFEVSLEGEFAAGEDFWPTLIRHATWIVEIDAKRTDPFVRYAIAPSLREAKAHGGGAVRRFEERHPDPRKGPFFQARILVRVGALPDEPGLRTWARQAAGVGIFMEGFRVLPYGERGNDWLTLDTDYARRSRANLAGQEHLPSHEDDVNVGLSILPNNAYFGAVFLTHAGAKSLRPLVNREGFVPDAALDHVRELTRLGIDLVTRMRAAASLEARRTKREQRTRRSAETRPDVALLRMAERARDLATEAQDSLTSGATNAAQRKLRTAVRELRQVADLSEDVVSESALLRILASVGMQMAAFIHEMNAVLAMSQSLDVSLEQLREDATDLPALIRRELGEIHADLGELRRNLERQASYLVDVLSPDARRRRSRQALTERFDAARRLVEHAAAMRSIRIRNRISADLRSPAMFPAEVTMVFANLLTNAVKSAGPGGKITVTGKHFANGTTRILIQNTGVAVKSADAERWFKPFESSTTSVDPVLGHGLGLGLPITRRILEEYGATIAFVKPTRDYATALRIDFPE